MWTPSSRPPVRCFRISMQKEGGVSGFSKLSWVRQTRAEPLRADSRRLKVSVRVRRVITSSSRVGSKIFAIFASVSLAFSSAVTSARVAASNAIVFCLPYNIYYKYVKGSRFSRLGRTSSPGSAWRSRAATASTTGNSVA